MASFQVRLFGVPQFLSPTGTFSFLPDKRFQLLAYLACQNTWSSRDEIATLFWSETSTETARHRLRQLLKRLRLLSLSDMVTIERDRLRWHVVSDVALFKESIAEQQTEALGLYGGPFLQGLGSDEPNDFNAWLEHERANLHSRWRSCVLSSAPHKAGPYLDRLLEYDPLDEEAVQHYLMVLAETRQFSKATQVYQRFAQSLGLDLGLVPTSTTEQLFRQLQGDDPEKQATLDGAVPRGAVPKPTRPALLAPANPLIGRDLELSSITQLLAHPDCHLLTLTGVGGVGKTRLALQVAFNVADQYRERYFFSLKTLPSPNALPQHLAERLGLRLEARTDPLEQLITYLHDKKALLVLTNFRQIADAAPLLADLVAACPNLKILVTSREKLGLEQEQCFPVVGLARPKALDSLSKALATDAARLFIERAKRVRPDFTVTEQDLPHLITICHTLEGMPLALELAAVWIRTLSLADLARELAHTKLLDSRKRTEYPPSIRAALENSWKLLNAKEQDALQQLSVFHGSFSREAASFVTGISVALLATLVDKSLLRVLANGRYDRHPLVYGFSKEKLLETGEQVQLQDNHARYYLAFAELADTQLHAKEQVCWFRRVDSELGNLRAALTFLETKGNAATALRLATALGYFWLLRGLYNEGLTHFTTLLSKTSGSTLIRAKALLHTGRFQFEYGDVQRAKACFEQSLDTAKHLGDKSLRAKAMLGLTEVSHHDKGDLRRVRLAYEASLELAKESGDTDTLVRVLAVFGGFEYAQVNHPKAERLLGEATRLAGTTGDKRSLISLFETRARLEAQTDDTGKAALLLAQADTLRQQLHIAPKKQQREDNALRWGLQLDEDVWTRADTMTLEQATRYLLGDT